MAVETEVSNSVTTVAAYEELTKLSLTDELGYEERTVEPIDGWGRGDFPEEEKEPFEQEAPNESKEEMKFKEAMIEELMESNHKLRMKFAEAENKIAKLRAKLDSHCECCSRNKGVEIGAARKDDYEWSPGPVSTFGQDSPYTNPFAASHDNANPYIKVRRWQTAFQMDFTRAESSSSSTVPRSPKCLTPRTGYIRPGSPARDYGNAGNVIHLPAVEDEPPAGFREIAGSPQKIFRGNLPQENQASYELEEEYPSRHLSSAKSSPDERILSSCQQQLGSKVSPFAAFRMPRPPRNSENLDVHVDPAGHYAAMQRTKQYILTQHANISLNANKDDRGIVGRLMAPPTGNEHK